MFEFVSLRNRSSLQGTVCCILLFGLPPAIATASDKTKLNDSLSNIREHAKFVEQSLMSSAFISSTSQPVKRSFKGLSPAVQKTKNIKRRQASLNFSDVAKKIRTQRITSRTTRYAKTKLTSAELTDGLEGQLPSDIKNSLEEIRSLSSNGELYIRFDETRKISSLKGNFRLSSGKDLTIYWNQ